MARRSKRADTSADVSAALPRIRGEVVRIALDRVRPNPWNPNRVPEHKMRSIVHGMKTDGWLASQALLIWATDEKGDRKDFIIDGEHRWKAASELKMTEGPAVFLDGITEAQAKALTVKMNQKRGEFDPASLGELLRSIEYQVAEWATDMALELAFKPEDLSVYLAEPPLLVDGPANPPSKPKGPDPGPGLPSGLPSTTNKLVQVHMTSPQFAKFEEAIRTLATKHGTTNISDTVYATILESAGVQP
jgi:hypothetical protein